MNLNLVHRDLSLVLMHIYKNDACTKLVHSLTFHCFSMLRELLSFGPDAKHHECLHGILYLKILRTARNNQEHIHHSVHVSLLSRTVLLKMFCITYNQISKDCIVENVLYNIQSNFKRM